MPKNRGKLAISATGSLPSKLGPVLIKAYIIAPKLMTVIIFATVENGANNFKFRTQFIKSRGMKNMSIYNLMSVSPIQMSNTSLIFFAINTTYTQQVPSWYINKKVFTTCLQQKNVVSSIIINLLQHFASLFRTRIKPF